MRTPPKILREARIAPEAVSYHVVLIGVSIGVFIVTIPLLLFVLPAVWLYYRRYFATLEVTLTSRELQVNRGIFVREEKSIPLEKITDLALFQGPIMRHLGLKGLRVETAGQSGSGTGALVRLIGIENTDDFRDAALDQRDKVTERLEQGASPAVEAARPHPSDVEKLLTEIRDVLVRMEARERQPGS